MICRDCRFWKWSGLDGGFVCLNMSSPFCGENTDYNDTCEGGVEDDEERVRHGSGGYENVLPEGKSDSE